MAELPGSARRGLPWLRFVVVAILVVLDQWSKGAAFAWLDELPFPEGMERDSHGHDRYPLLGDWLALMTSENPGAAFGRLGEWPRTLVTGRVIAVIVLAISLWRTRREHTLLLWGVVLVLAGAGGNLIDNLWFGPRLEGHPFGLVRDFIDVYFARWDWHFPTFNVADSCITVGAGCFLLYGFVQPESPDVKSADEDEDVPPPAG